MNMHRFSVAPMMDWTDRHDRYFLRLITRRALLYSEMVTSAAVLYGARARLLGFHTAEHPVALQLGGSDPKDLAEAARIGADFGYDEINLNLGCPSDRVQRGRFGACLMREPALVARCLTAMIKAVALPVTVKCRIGVDEQDSFEDLLSFVDCLAQTGVRTFIIHARKAWLEGLSPKENREIPPLNYERVFALKAAFPKLQIILNGGLTSPGQSLAYLSRVDGVMFGRAAYQNPYCLAEVDRLYFGAGGPAPTRRAIMEAFLPYIEEELARGTPLHHMTRHILGLYNGLAGARVWRQSLSGGALQAATSKGVPAHEFLETLVETVEEKAAPEKALIPAA